MKGLLVNGSPHKEGCTCIACKTCVQKEECVFDDKVNELLDVAGEYGGFAFGSPVHWGGASGAITSFLDRAFYADFCGGGNRSGIS